MQEVIESLQAPPDRPLNVWIEPWGEELTFPPGTLVELRAVAPLRGELAIDSHEQGIVVYACSGSTLKVLVRDEVVRDFSIPVPEIPAGMDMKGFVGFLFSQRPEKRTKPWWRFFET